MSELERACDIGDILEVIAPLSTSSWDDEAVLAVQPKGQLYRVAGLVGRGWDLELLSGDAPRQLRVLNSEVPGLLKRRPELKGSFGPAD